MHGRSTRDRRFTSFTRTRNPTHTILSRNRAAKKKPAQVSCWSWEQQHGQCKHITIRVWYCSEVGLNRRSLYFRRLSAVHAPTHIRWWYTSVHHRPTTRNREPHSYIHWWSNDAVVCLPTWCIISRRTINQRLQSRKIAESMTITKIVVISDRPTTMIKIARWSWLPRLRNHLL